MNEFLRKVEWENLTHEVLQKKSKVVTIAFFPWMIFRQTQQWKFWPQQSKYENQKLEKNFKNLKISCQFLCYFFSARTFEWGYNELIQDLGRKTQIFDPNDEWYWIEVRIEWSIIPINGRKKRKNQRNAQSNFNRFDLTKVLTETFYGWFVNFRRFFLCGNIVALIIMFFFFIFLIITVIMII